MPEFYNQQGPSAASGGYMSMGGFIGGAQAQGGSLNSPRPVSPIEQASSGINSAVQELARLTGQAATIADQVFGSRPEAPGTAGGQDKMHAGTLGNLSLEVASLHQVITNLRVQIERLSCL